MKIGAAICLILALIGMFAVDSMLLPNQGWLVNFLVLSGLLIGMKFLFGGWSAYSVKWMVISCVMSTLGAEIMVISKMMGDGRTFSFWICMIPIIIGAIGGILSYKWVNDILDDSTTSNINVENLLDSVFDNGIKNTFWGIVDSYNANLYYAYGRGVAVYSNLVIFSGFATMIFLN